MASNWESTSPIGLSASTTPGEVEMTPHELLLLAIRMHQENRLEAAERCYRALLQVDPDNANARHYLGVLLHQSGRQSQGLELIQASIASDPGVAPWHNNLGNVLLDAGRFDAAVQAYHRCAELDPDNLEVLNNLGVLHSRLGNVELAEAALRRAIARKPDFVGSYNNLAALCMNTGRMTEAFSWFADALALRPLDARSHRLLAAAYGKAGRLEEGRQHCLKWLELQPGDPLAQHFYAALGGAVVPERASDEYVVAEFDGFAASFDAKLASLDYQAPQWVGQAVARLLGEPQASLGVLDAGCGTGLCGPLLRPYARRLAGVDLSANMLALARQRGLYDELAQAELVAYLQLANPGSYDLVVSADTLCYFGRLEAAFAAVRRALRAGGHWVFTVEAMQGGSELFCLQTHGRYSHARTYVEQALAGAGFTHTELQQVVLRMESKEPVAGWLVAAW